MKKQSRRELLTSAAATLPIGAVALAATAAPVLAQSKTTQSLTTLVNTFVPGVGGFVGTLTVTGFQLVNGVLSAVGTIAGNVLGPTGSVLGTITQSATVPAQVAGSCQVLTLTLGPLHLDVLGLVVDLNQVVLNITAVPGAGNLLGNLLCAVANLLNGGGAVATLLNNLTNL